MNRKQSTSARGIGSTALVAVVALGLALGASSTFAQDTAQPARRAVRLAFVEGKVQVAQNEAVLSEQAAVNTPLFEGAQVATAEDGRAEVQFEDGSLVRLTPNSSLILSKLSQQEAVLSTEITLQKGLGYFELQPTATSQIALHFGTSVATASAITVLRVGLDNQPGEVAVFTGAAHVVREGVAADVKSGQSLRLNPSAAAGYDLTETITPDSWDNWNADRDQTLQNEAAQQTEATGAGDLASDNNPAWADLDSNGNWYNVPDQGKVWVPTVASNSGWDPYGSGNWTWTPSYGYIWNSSYNWGYLPYQCGLWNFYDFGWGWSPGACSPWWQSGSWYLNIGRSPGWYRRPERPRPGPPTPRGPTARPIIAGGQMSPHPVIPVTRGPIGTYSGDQSRNRFAPVNQGGMQIQALRPTASRPVYAQPGSGFSYRPSSSSSGSRQFQLSPSGGQGSFSGRQPSLGNEPRNSGPSTIQGPAPSMQPGYRQPQATPSPRPSGNGYAPSGGNTGSRFPSASSTNSGGGASARPSGGSNSGGGSFGGGAPRSSGGGSSGGGAPRSSGGGSGGSRGGGRGR